MITGIVVVFDVAFPAPTTFVIELLESLDVDIAVDVMAVKAAVLVPAPADVVSEVPIDVDIVADRVVPLAAVAACGQVPDTTFASVTQLPGLVLPAAAACASVQVTHFFDQVANPVPI
jgi:hypothetical protein